MFTFGINNKDLITMKYVFRSLPSEKCIDPSKTMDKLRQWTVAVLPLFTLTDLHNDEKWSFAFNTEAFLDLSLTHIMLEWTINVVFSAFFPHCRWGQGLQGRPQFCDVTTLTCLLILSPSWIWMVLSLICLFRVRRENPGTSQLWVLV